ncbi:sugar ABC transporter substrate-binding protein [Microbacterium lushaniae]|nr:sugar ABC transporter substrate-binding protein [Microbacterium lushaniae]KAA9155238.1 sugar ABC transporter substrate-binding protein [Microbacterium lushaniae]
MVHASRRLTRRIVALGATAALAVSLAACAGTSGDGGGGGEAEGDITVGLAVPNQQSPFFVAIREWVENEAESEGVELVFADAKNDADTQVSQIQDFITQQVDAIIYIPAGATAATVPVREAKSAGIPVVTVDRNPDGAPGDTFIATDSVASAKALGEFVVEQTGGEGNLGIIQGQLGTTPEEARDEGFTEGISGSNIVEVARQASEAWLQDEGYDLATDMLQAHPDINIIFGRADGLALGAAQAARNAGFDDILVVGFDGDPSGLEAVASGELAATVTQQTTLMGKLALQSALDLINGEELPAEQLQEGILTTKDNVEEYLENHP